MNKKNVFISLFVLILICISIVGVVFAINKNKPKLEYQIESIKEIDYLLFCENNKFGVINKNGDVVIQAKYDEIQIPNPSKPLFVCKYDYNPEKNQYKIKILNDKSEQILYQFVFAEAIELEPGISEIPYEKSVLKYMDKGKYGLIDFQGNIIVKAKYDEINSFEYNEGLLIVKRNGKYGIININGAVFVKEKYDKILSDGYYKDGLGYTKSGFIVGIGTEDNLKYGYINREGKQILEEKFDQIGRIENTKDLDNIYIVAFENGKAGLYKNKDNILKHEYEDIGYDKNNNCLIVQQNGKQGIFNLNGNTEIELKYDNIYISGKYINAQIEKKIDIYDYNTKQRIDLENIVGLNQTTNNNYVIAITNNEKFKILDISKNELKKSEYNYLEYVYDNYFITFKNKKFGIIDSDNNKIIDFKYDSIQRIGDTHIIQTIDYDKNITSLIYNNKVIASMKNAEIVVKQGFIIMKSDNDIEYIDFDGNIIENRNIIDKQLYTYNSNGKWGFVNKDGEIIVEPIYEFVTEFNEYGFAGIKNNEKWGVINLKGDIIIEPIYKINSNSPNFIGKYYEKDLGYGKPYFICE